MKINNQHYRTIWLHPTDPTIVQIIDQRYLPHRLVLKNLTNVVETATAIREMWVRGAPLIGATAAYGLYLATLVISADSFDDELEQAAQQLAATRPTAINLQWAIDRQLKAIASVATIPEKQAMALATAKAICEEDVDICWKIGQYGLSILEKISQQKNGEVVNILTHCNAGWLATVDWGTATAPIYQAHDKGIQVHVWVDETRPRNQGARITAYELQQHGVPHTVIVDNLGGHLMQQGLVDLCIVGTDRTTYAGDVANKIGTYLKALAAKDNDVPFYVALPSTTIDWNIKQGKDIPIEERGAEEVKYIQGLGDGGIQKVLLTPKDSPAVNYGFDVTPARLVTGLITERGVCAATEEGIRALFPEQ